MKFSSHFEFIIDYILNKASPEELSGIEMALEKRKKNTPFSLKDINFEKMAKEMSSKISGSFSIDVKAMAKRIVTQLILEKEPNISEEHLEKLLEYYVPNEKKKSLPKEIIFVMIQHFIDYSLGKMDKKTIEELKQSSPNWYEKYWNAFPHQIRVLISDFLKAKMNSYEFWEQVKKILN
ncbi:MAG: hypothetical protein ACK4UJ_11775 [Leptonema sp. (in: bacteria)]